MEVLSFLDDFSEPDDEKDSLIFESLRFFFRVETPALPRLRCLFTAAMIDLNLFWSTFRGNHLSVFSLLFCTVSVFLASTILVFSPLLAVPGVVFSLSPFGLEMIFSSFSVSFFFEGRPALLALSAGRRFLFAKLSLG